MQLVVVRCFQFLVEFFFLISCFDAIFSSEFFFNGNWNRRTNDVLSKHNRHSRIQWVNDWKILIHYFEVASNFMGHVFFFWFTHLNYVELWCVKNASHAFKWIPSWIDVDFACNILVHSCRLNTDFMEIDVCFSKTYARSYRCGNGRLCAIANAKWVKSFENLFGAVYFIKWCDGERL